MLMTCPVKDIFFGGARGGGKTDGMLGYWLRHSAKYGNKAKGILFRRTMPELDEVVSRSQEIYAPLGAEFKTSKKTWIMPDGATLKMRYLERDDHATRYQGHSYSWAGFDELGNWAMPDAIDKIRATLRSAHGVPCCMLSTGNPGGLGHTWIKDRYIKNRKPLEAFYDEAKKTWRVYIPSRLQDNKILCENDPEYVNRLAASGAAWLVKAWLEGDWDAVQEGAILKREYWGYYSVVPAFNEIIQSWDTAFKAKQENDNSVCLTIGVTRSAYFIIDCWCGKIEFPELKNTAISLAAKYKPNRILIEDKASGQSLIQELQRNTTLPVLPIKVDTDKVARANAVTGLLAAQRVFLPSDGSWVLDFVDECALFPEGVHDDRVDALTQGLNHLALLGQTGLSDYYRALSEEKSATT